MESKTNGNHREAHYDGTANKGGGAGRISTVSASGTVRGDTFTQSRKMKLKLAGYNHGWGQGQIRREA